MVYELDRQDMMLRTAALNACQPWHGIDEDGSILAGLLGCADYSSLVDAQTKDDQVNQVLKALAGPNGFTVYKMLLARKLP